MTAKPNRIFVSHGPGETRCALVEDETVLEAVFIRDAEAQTGAVYAGQVTERAPGSADMFVDIGIAPHGLLETKGQKFTGGQLIAVEVVASARADKGHKLKIAALPANVSKPGLIQAAPHPVLVWWKAYGHTLDEVVVERARKAMTQLLGPDATVVESAANELTFAEIDEQIDAALEATVHLPGGGRVIFESTSALTAVDIDAGSSDIAQANSEAMSAIAQHMRLRNLAGHIVVDLIHTKGKMRFVEQLKELCASDPVDTRIMGLTPSGMIDIVRQRVRPSLAETLLNDETTAYRALRLAARELVVQRTARVELKVAPHVAALLNEKLKAALTEARDVAKGEIRITPETTFAANRIEVSA
ncbi:MAG: ribonuclease E/G [Rhodospirillaceae bacterium]|nr:ribonuclease E/G [Rhodospirillaceae bacterium]